MFAVNAYPAKALLISALMFGGVALISSQALGDVNEEGNVHVLLAELVVGGAGSVGKGASGETHGADRQIDRARMYEQQDDDDDGLSLTAPSTMPHPPGWSPSAVDRARVYRDSKSATEVEGITGDVLQRDDSPAARSAAENRRKARVYSSTATGNDIDLSYVGRDGIPLVKCEPIDNVSGRIGDDSLPGSLVMIFVRGKQIKVRCR
jgi:hypothetical protein